MKKLNLRRLGVGAGVLLVLLSIASFSSFLKAADNIQAAGTSLELNKDFTIENCGTPLKVLRLLGSILYKHPDTGDFHLFMEYGNNNGYRIGEQEWDNTANTLIDINLKTGKIRRCRTARPGGVSTDHYFHPNGKIYLFEAKTLPASFAEYDTRTGKYQRITMLNNQAYVKRLAENGTIYGGEVSGDVWSYVPETKVVTRYYTPTGRKVFWGCYFMEIDPPWIYSTMTNHGHWFLNIIDTRTGKSTNYFDTESGQKAAANKKHSVTKYKNGQIFYGDYLLKDGKPLMNDKGEPQQFAKPDEKTRLDTRRPWPNMWRVTGYAGKVYSDITKSGLDFDMADAEPNNWNDGVATVKWRKADSKKWNKIIIKGFELVGSSPQCLAAGEDGVLYGVGTMYGKVFSFDPKTGKSREIGNPPNSVAAILVLQDNIYFSGYCHGLAKFDKNKPYQVKAMYKIEKDANPEILSAAGKWNDIMLKGPDGRIYVGGKNGRHFPGGGLTIYDPAIGKLEKLYKPYFEYLAVSGLYFINNGKTLAITTYPLTFGRKGTPEKGSIYLYDLARKKITKEIKLDIKANPDQIFIAGNNQVIGVSRSKETDEYNRTKHFTLVYGLDLKTGKTTFEKKYPGRAFSGICVYDKPPLVRGPDGDGWLFVGEWLCRIHGNGNLEKIRKMNDRGKMFFQGNTLYIYNGGRVRQRRFANVIKIKDLFKPKF